MVRLAYTLLASAFLTSAEAHAQTTDTYYPIEVGTKFGYRTTYTRSGSTEEHSEVVTEVAETKRGLFVTTAQRRERTEPFIAIIDGVPQKPGRYVAQSASRCVLRPDGIYYLGEVGEENDTREDSIRHCVMKLPPDAGTRWSYESDKVDYRWQSVIGMSKRIKVPAGTFDAVPIYTESVHEGKPLPRRVDWLEKRVGHIKTTIGKDVTIELISIEKPAKP